MVPRSSRSADPASLPSHNSSPRQWPLVASMIAAIAVVTSLAWWDERREAEAALRDLEAEQSVLAASLAESLRAQLTGSEDARDLRATAAGLLEQERRVGRSDLAFLVATPSAVTLRTVDGQALASPVLERALGDGLTSMRLSRSQAAQVGLAARTAVAGIARVDVPSLGRWGVVVVASAARERDRGKRALWRLVLGVLVASGLVIAFGGAALRKQRKELELRGELAIAEAQRARDEELLRAQRVATMGTFAMGIAHEVSTPLGVIMGRAEQLLARTVDDGRMAHSAQTILKQADRIQHIVRRFLDMARGRPPSFERTNPAEIARAAAASVEHRFTKANVSLACGFPETMPSIQCDRHLLEHAIVNLLLNACEACGSGGHVELTAHSDTEQVTFVVADDGTGISSEAAALAAQPFFTTKPHGAGSGLGLAIASEIVKSHRGNFVIAPNEGKGTRACVEIPFSPAEVSNA